MKLNLLSCDVQRPDKRAIANCMVAISNSVGESLSHELTAILLEGDTIAIEVDDKSTGSALRALRKLGIDYEIIT